MLVNSTGLGFQKHFQDPRRQFCYSTFAWKTHFYGSVSTYQFRAFSLFKNCPSLRIPQGWDSKDPKEQPDLCGPHSFFFGCKALRARTKRRTQERDSGLPKKEVHKQTFVDLCQVSFCVPKGPQGRKKKDLVKGVRAAEQKGPRPNLCGPRDSVLFLASRPIGRPRKKWVKKLIQGYPTLRDKQQGIPAHACYCSLKICSALKKQPLNRRLFSDTGIVRTRKLNNCPGQFWNRIRNNNSSTESQYGHFTQ